MGEFRLRLPVKMPTVGNAREVILHRQPRNLGLRRLLRQMALKFLASGAIQPGGNQQSQEVDQPVGNQSNQNNARVQDRLDKYVQQDAANGQQ